MKSFGNRHPTVLITYFMSVIAITVFVTNPVLQLSAFLGGILYASALRKQSIGISGFKFYLIMFLLISLTNPIFSHKGNTPLFYLNGSPVTKEAVICGFALGFSVLSVLLWFKCFSTAMDSESFLYVFGNIMPETSLVLSMSLRFIPEINRRFKKVSSAQKAMGLYSSGYFDRLKEAGRVYSSVIAVSLENAMETSSAMKSRGYGTRKRTSFSVFCFTKTDAFILCTTVILTAITVFVIARNEMRFSFYPAVSHISTSPTALIGYASFFILCVLPFIYEIKEIALWKYCVSKI